MHGSSREVSHRLKRPSSASRLLEGGGCSGQFLPLAKIPPNQPQFHHAAERSRAIHAVILIVIYLFAGMTSPVPGEGGCAHVKKVKTSVIKSSIFHVDLACAVRRCELKT